VLGLVAFGAELATVVLAVAVFVSSSAITVKALIDFRRLADDETDLVLAILVFEDLVVALALGFVAGAGGEASDTLIVVAKALLFVGASLARPAGSRAPSTSSSTGSRASSSSSPSSPSSSACRRCPPSSASPRPSAR
jgi:Kef-type K+ transport system membrane component KefB